MEAFLTTLLLTAAAFGFTMPNNGNEKVSPPVTTAAWISAKRELPADANNYQSLESEDPYLSAKNDLATNSVSQTNARPVIVRQNSGFKVLDLFLQVLRTISANASALQLTVCNLTPLCSISVADFFPKSRQMQLTGGFIHSLFTSQNINALADFIQNMSNKYKVFLRQFYVREQKYKKSLA